MNQIHIAHLRRRAKLTQLGLAQRIGVARETIARWESGQTLPRTSLLGSLATALGCGIRDLFADKPEVA